MALDAFTSFALLVWDAKVATEKWAVVEGNMAHSGRLRYSQLNQDMEIWHGDQLMRLGMMIFSKNDLVLSKMNAIIFSNYYKIISKAKQKVLNQSEFVQPKY